MRTKNIDLATVGQLFQQHQHDLVACVDLFAMRSERNLRDLRRAMADTHVGAASFVLRRMRSSAVHLELTELAVVLKRTELKLKSGNPTHISNDIEEIAQLTQIYVAEVRRELQNRLSH